jgi:hypothetical protein
MGKQGYLWRPLELHLAPLFFFVFMWELIADWMIKLCIVYMHKLSSARALSNCKGAGGGVDWGLGFIPGG